MRPTFMKEQGKVIRREQMHRAPVRPTFDQSLGIDIGATDGQTMESMAQKLCLHTAKVFHNGLGIGRVQKMLSE
jgi:hypothetical protein